MPIKDRAQIAAVEQRDGSFSEYADMPDASTEPMIRRRASEAGYSDGLGHDDGDSFSIWPMLEWLDKLDNAKRAGLAEWMNGGSDVLGAAARGFSYEKYTSVADVMTAYAKKFEPEKYEEWKAKQQERLLLQDRYGTELILDGDAASNSTNPYGAQGEVVGLGLDIVLSPMNLVPFGIIGKGAGKAAEATALVRFGKTKAVEQAAFDQLAEVAAKQGVENLKARGLMTTIGLKGALEERVATATRFTVEEGEAYTRMRRWLEESPRLKAEIKRERGELQSLKIDLKKMADEGADELTLESLAEGVDAKRKEIAYLRSQRKELRVALEELTPDDAVRAMLTIVDDVDNGLWDDIAAELVEKREGFLGPVSDATRGMMADGRLVSSPDVAAAEMVGRLETLQNLADDVLRVESAAAGTDIFLPGQQGYKAFIASRAAAREFVGGDRFITRLVDEGGSPSLLVDKVSDFLREKGLPENVVGPMTSEYVNALDAANQMQRLISNSQDLYKVTYRMSAAEVGEVSARISALSYRASLVERQIAQKLSANRRGFLAATGERVVLGKGYMPTAQAQALRASMDSAVSLLDGLADVGYGRAKVAARGLRSLGIDKVDLAGKIGKSERLKLRKARDRVDSFLRSTSSESIDITKAQRKQLVELRRELDGAIDPALGKSFLSKEEAAQLRQTLNSLKEAHSNMLIKARGDVMQVAERMTRRVLIDLDAWRAQTGAVGAVTKPIAAGIARGAEMGGPVGSVARAISQGRRAPPFGTWLGLTSPARTFRGTGAYEILSGRTHAYTESLQHYAKRIDEAVGNMKATDRELLADLANGTLTAEAVAKMGKQHVIDAEKGLRAIFDELADLEQLPKEKRITAYFPHVVDKDARLRRALEEGHLPPEFDGATESFGYIVHSEDLGKKWTSPFMRRRKGKVEEFKKDARDVAMIYASSVLKSHYLSPGFDEVATLIRGEAAKAAKKSGKAFGKASELAKIPGAVHLSPNHRQMLSYLDDVEKVIHGQPVHLANVIYDRFNDLKEIVGFGDAARLARGELPKSASNAAALSSAITANIYRSLIGLSPATPAINLTQGIIDASQYGAMASLRGAASYFASGADPIEAALQGAVRDGKKWVDLSRASKDLNMQMYRSYEEMHDVRRIARAGAVKEQLGGPTLIKMVGLDKADRVSASLSVARDKYDKTLFFMMDGTERFNRGVSFHVGMTMAQRNKLPLFDQFRFAQMVSDEANFVYGMLGRGPQFQNPYLRPIISPFTSYPMGMAGVVSRMFRENPTALLRFIGNYGAAASAVSKVGLDPGNQLMPWAFLPAKYMWTNGITPLARFFLSAGKFALAEDAIEREKYSADVVESTIMMAGLPWRATKQFMSPFAFAQSGQAESMRNFLKAIPVVGDTFFSTQNPIYTTEEAEFLDAWTIAHYSVAKLLGFQTLTEGIVEKAYERGRKYHREYQIERARKVRSALDYQDPFEFMDEEWEEMNAFAEEYGFESAMSLIDSVEQSKKSLLSRQLERLPRFARHRVATGTRRLAELPGVNPEMIADWAEMDGETQMIFMDGLE